MQRPMREEPLAAREKREDGKHGWLWMVLCCIPMILIAVLLILGIWSW